MKNFAPKSRLLFRRGLLYRQQTGSHKSCLPYTKWQKICQVYLVPLSSKDYKTIWATPTKKGFFEHLQNVHSLRMARLIGYSINWSINSTKMTFITDLLIINHLIYVFVTLKYLPLVFRHLTIIHLKFEQVQFTTHCCVLNSWVGGKQCRPWWDAEFGASHLGLHCLLRPV